ncbi:MAG: hypothetical protein K0B37_15825 [Bacteroidales bacterium]|nr:hypothetical protein [Bacteroidales bacterium]
MTVPATSQLYSHLGSSLVSSPDSSDPYVVKIGSENTHSEVPFGFMWKYSLSQIIYPSNEINVTRGVLTGLQFETLINTTINNNKITIWIGEVQRQNLLPGWTDISVLQKVFEGNVDFPAGTKKLFITFDKNYQYNGGNLLIHVHKSADALAGNNFFIASEAQESSRVLIVQRDNIPYQMFERDEIGVSMRTIPNLTLFFSPEGLVSERELKQEPFPVAGIARISPPGVTTVKTTAAERRQPTVTPADRVSAERTSGRSLRSSAREQRNLLSLGTDASLTLYDGDYLYPVILPGFEISVGYLQNRALSFGWNVGIGRAESTELFYANFAYTGLDLRYRLNNRSTMGSPFADVGGGILYHTQGTRIESERSFDTNLMFFLNFSLGYEWLLNRNSTIHLSMSNRQLLSDDIDGLVYGKYNDRIWSIDLGFRYYLGNNGNRR